MNKVLNVDCWIPWKLCPLKARQDPRQKQKCKRLRGGGFEAVVYILTSPGWGPKPSASSRKWWGPYFRRGGLANMDKEKALPSYRAVIGFYRTRLLQGLGYTERESRLLSCGEGCFIELEQHTGQKFLPQRSRIFFVLVTFSRAGFFPWPGSFVRWEQSAGKKNLPWRNRMLGLVAFQETWLRRTRFPASFLWCWMACRVAASGFFRGLNCKSTCPGFFPVVRGAL